MADYPIWTTNDPTAKWYAGGLEELVNPKGAAERRARELLGKTEDTSAKLLGQNAALQPQLMGRAQRTLATNPYQTAIADQNRAAQLALMQQMEAQRQGPSLAAMQGQGAMGQSTQQALAAGALGQGRNAMLGSRMAAGGLASDVARARMMEDLKARAGIAGVAGGLREQDIRSAEQQQRAGLAAQGMSDEMARFYAAQGSSLDKATRDALLENYKLRQRVGQSEQERAMAGQANTMQTGGSILSMLFGM